MIQIVLPLTEAQTKAFVIAADGLGIEPWELAVHALAMRQRIELDRKLRLLAYKADE